MKDRYLHGLDYGRAVFAIAVVAWHTQALGRSNLFDPTAGSSPDAASVVYLNALLIAVPFFLATSLFLYLRTREQRPDLLWSRMRRLLVLTAFWVGLWTIVVGVGHIVLSNAPDWLLTGGRSIFYFLVELVLLTLVMELVARMGAARSTRFAAAGLAACTALIGLRVPLGDLLGSNSKFVLAYWSPLCFLPYVFVALLVFRLWQSGYRPTPRRVAVLVIAYAGVAALEWAALPRRGTFAIDATVMPAYARPSLVVAAAGILWVCVDARWNEAPRQVRLLAELSLAIYCIHPFIYRNLAHISPAVFRRVETRPLLLFLVVLVVTLALGYAARRERVV